MNVSLSLAVCRLDAEAEAECKQRTFASRGEHNPLSIEWDVSRTRGLLARCIERVCVLVIRRSPPSNSIVECMLLLCVRVCAVVRILQTRRPESAAEAATTGRMSLILFNRCDSSSSSLSSTSFVRVRVCAARVQLYTHAANSTHTSFELMEKVQSTIRIDEDAPPTRRRVISNHVNYVACTTTDDDFVNKSHPPCPCAMHAYGVHIRVK